jgi:hypothetical protein
VAPVQSVAIVQSKAINGNRAIVQSKAINGNRAIVQSQDINGNRAVIGNPWQLCNRAVKGLVQSMAWCNQWQSVAVVQSVATLGVHLIELHKRC